MGSWYDLKAVTIKDLKLPDRFKKGIQTALDVIDSFQLEGLCSVILFGSCAAEKVKTSSDIDLLIVTKELIADRRLRSLIRESIDEKLSCFQVSADIVFYTVSTLETDASVFTCNIRRYGKILMRR